MTGSREDILWVPRESRLSDRDEGRSFRGTEDHYDTREVDSSTRLSALRRKPARSCSRRPHDRTTDRAARVSTSRLARFCFLGPLRARGRSTWARSSRRAAAASLLHLNPVARPSFSPPPPTRPSHDPSTPSPSLLFTMSERPSNVGILGIEVRLRLRGIGCRRVPPAPQRSFLLALPDPACPCVAAAGRCPFLAQSS